MDRNGEEQFSGDLESQETMERIVIVKVVSVEKYSASATIIYNQKNSDNIVVII